MCKTKFFSKPKLQKIIKTILKNLIKIRLLKILVNTASPPPTPPGAISPSIINFCIKLAKNINEVGEMLIPKTIFHDICHNNFWNQNIFGELSAKRKILDTPTNVLLKVSRLASTSVYQTCFPFVSFWYQNLILRLMLITCSFKVGRRSS